MNLEIGEYVRTEIGTIGKVVRINEIYFTIENNRGEIDVLYEGNQKHSKNIIDLIEVGDFVKIEYFSNRYSKRVKRIFEVDCIIDKSVCFTNGYYTLNILNGEWANQDKEVKPIIKSIVTKQQFSNMEYRLWV